MNITCNYYYVLKEYLDLESFDFNKEYAIIFII